MSNTTVMSSQPDSRPVVVGLFESRSSARDAVGAMRSFGLTEQQYGVVSPGEALNVSNATPFMASALAAAEVPNDLEGVLAMVGLPEGEARFYAEQASE